MKSFKILEKPGPFLLTALNENIERKQQLQPKAQLLLKFSYPKFPLQGHML